MRSGFVGLVVLSCCAVLGLMTPAQAQTPAAVEPKAEEILQAMGETLKSAKSLTFDAHSIRQVVDAQGQKLDSSRNARFTLRRPDGLHVKTVGDLNLEFWYDGKTIALLNAGLNQYAVAEAAANIDEMFDTLAGKYGITIPLSDLLMSDPKPLMLEQVHSGRYVGEALVFDRRCHHLAFRQASIDWQIWIEAGEQPLPRKVVITYKDLPGDPQYTAYFLAWDLQPEIAADVFTFAAPDGVTKVELDAPATQPAR